MQRLVQRTLTVNNCEISENTALISDENSPFAVMLKRVSLAGRRRFELDLEVSGGPREADFDQVSERHAGQNADGYRRKKTPRQGPNGNAFGLRVL